MISYERTVLKVEQRSRRVYLDGVGNKAVFRDEPTGWWIMLSDHRVLGVGIERPAFEPGDVVRISMRKA